MSAALAICGGKPVRTRPFPAWPVCGGPEESAVLAVLRSGRWGRWGESEVARFERRFAERHGARFGVAVTSGTAALRIALLACDLKAGDEVIVPPYTFLATATAVIEANLTPVFVDINEATFNIDPDAIERAVTPRTRAIIPVHVGGLPAEMDAILAIADRHGLAVIEDAAHAHGARYKGKPVGSLGDLGCFSFQSSKNLSSGEGGMLLSSDPLLASRCEAIHNCGRMPDGPWYEHHIISGNYRMTNFQGAILNCQLDRLDGQFARRAENAALLRERLGRIPGIRPQATGDADTTHAYHLFLFRYDARIYGVPRSAFLRALEAEGIPACEGYTLPLYRQPVFVNRAFGPYTACLAQNPELDFVRTQCPVCERTCTAEGAWLFQSLLLGTRDDVEDIARAFEKLYEHRAELRAARAARATA